jgi:hypothetical protein
MKMSRLSSLFSRRTAQKGIAVGTAVSLLVLASIAGVGVASASAHTGAAASTATCDTSTGLYNVTEKVSYGSVPSGVKGTVSLRTGTSTFQNWSNYGSFNDWGVIGTTDGASGSITTTYTLPGNTTSAPWKYIWINWSDNFNQQQKFDDRPEGLKGDCNVPDKKDAAVIHSTTAATCTSGEILNYSGTNVTFTSASTPNGTVGPLAKYVVTANATAHHKFADGKVTATFGGALAAKLAANDPLCRTVQTGAPTFTVATCAAPNNNLAHLPGVLGGIYTVTGGKDNSSSSLAIGTGYDGTYLNGLGTYTVTLADGNPNDEYTVTPGSWTWTPTNPATVTPFTCATVVTPVVPAVVKAPVCGASGSATSVPVKGVTYAEQFNPTTGDYTFTATPTDSTYKFAGNDTTDQTITFTGNVGANVACPTTSGCEVVTNAPTITNLNQMLTVDTRANGHLELVPNALHAYTDDSSSLAKAAAYIPTNFPLADAGVPSIDVTTNSGATAGLNLTVYSGTTWLGNLVLEPLFPKYWSSMTVAGMPAGPNPSYQHSYGTLDEYLAGLTNAGRTNLTVQAVGFSLGSGALGDNDINSITANCVKHAFDTAPVIMPANPHVNIVAGCAVDGTTNTGGAIGSVYLSNDFVAGHNVAGSAYSATIYDNGVAVKTVSVPASSSSTYVTYNFAQFGEDSGTHDITVKVGDKVIAEQSVDTNCTVTTITPTVTIACAALDKVNLPVDTADVKYIETVDANNMATVKATAAEGKSFASGVQSTWQFQLVQRGACTVVNIVKLAFTGSNATPTFAIGGWLIGLGLLFGAFSFWYRRRHSHVN